MKDGYTLDTGLGGDVVFVATPASTTDDIVVTATSQSNGVITLGLYEAGSSYSTSTTLYWFAFLRKGDFTSGTATFYPSSMPNVAFGVSTIADAGTVNPFPGRRDHVVFVSTGSTADTLVTVTSQTTGTVTLGVTTAGVAATSELIHWMAIATTGSAEPTTCQTIIPGLTCGMAECQDGSTIDTGLGATVGIVCCAEVADTSVVISTQTNGIATLLMDVASSATAAAETVQWIAFHEVYK